MKKREIITAAFLVGFFIIFLVSGYNGFQKSPEGLNATVNSDLEKTAAQQGIQVMQVGNIEYKFQESVGFGGAGGLGGIITTAVNKSDIITVASRGKSIIYYDYIIDREHDLLNKRYMATDPHVAIIWKDTYDIQSLCKHYGLFYGIKEINGSEIIFQKDQHELFITSVILFVVLLIIYVVLVWIIFPCIWED